MSVTGDQSGSVCHDANVDFNLSDNGISENETDTDVSYVLLAAVAIDREARVFFRRYMGDLFDSGRGETVEPNTMKGFFRATTSVLPGISVAVCFLDVAFSSFEFS